MRIGSTRGCTSETLRRRGRAQGRCSAEGRPTGGGCVLCPLGILTRTVVHMIHVCMYIHVHVCTQTLGIRNTRQKDEDQDINYIIMTIHV